MPTLAERKRNAIVAAAVHEFETNGFGGTSMDRVAATAGVSKRTVYNHFPSKDELFAAIVTCLGQQMGSLASREYLPDVPLDKQLRAIANDMLEVMTGECFVKLARVVISRFVESPELAARTIAQQPDFAAVLSNWIRAARKDGSLSVTSVDAAVTQFKSLLMGEAFWPQLITGQPPLTKAQKARVVRTSVNMFLSYYG